MTFTSKQIWAYVHGELPPEERERFEQALQDDAELREALEACRMTHGTLESLMPLPDEAEDADDELERRLIAEWEAEHPEHAEAPARKPGRKILPFTLPAAAAAAAVILLLALPWHKAPVKWQRTVYGTPPQLRGQLSTQPYYTRAELKQINHELQQAIEGHLAEASEKWKLKIHLQELAKGALAVEVSGSQRTDPSTPARWSESYESLAAFRENIPAFGQQVADGLTGRNDP